MGGKKKQRLCSMFSKRSKFPCFIKVFSYVRSHMWLFETLIGSITCLKGYKGNTETTHNGTKQHINDICYIPPPHIIPLSVVYMFFWISEGYTHFLRTQYISSNAFCSKFSGHKLVSTTWTRLVPCTYITARGDTAGWAVNTHQSLIWNLISLIS